MLVIHNRIVSIRSKLIESILDEQILPNISELSFEPIITVASGVKLVAKEVVMVSKHGIDCSIGEKVLEIRSSISCGIKLSILRLSPDFMINIVSSPKDKGEIKVVACKT